MFAEVIVSNTATHHEWVVQLTLAMFMQLNILDKHVRKLYSENDYSFFFFWKDHQVIKVWTKFKVY